MTKEQQYTMEYLAREGYVVAIRPCRRDDGTIDVVHPDIDKPNLFIREDGIFRRS